jgi:hypothetical protein
MKLAILGTDPDIIELAVAAIRNGHAIAWTGDVRSGEQAALAQIVGSSPDRANEWEWLLDRGIVDAVLVGRGTANSELRAERIKRLAVEGVPMLVVHPVFESVLPCYEIDMAHRESGGLIRHYNPLAEHPVVQHLAEHFSGEQTQIGSIHQLTCERRVAVADRELVLAHFARDVELLAAIAGDIRRVTAIGPAVDAVSFASLQVQMMTDNAASLRWSVSYSKTGQAGLELSLMGENGSVKLQISDDATPVWQLESDADSDRISVLLEPYGPAEAAIIELANAVGNSSVPGQRSEASTWDTAIRAMEVVDAAELSLQKGRTIEVFQQQLTERLAFRGTMAAFGCGLLLLAFVAIVVIAILGGAEGVVRQRLLPAWPLVLLAVLAFFLLLQAVPFLSRKQNSDHATSEPVALKKPDRYE